MMKQNSMAVFYVILIAEVPETQRFVVTLRCEWFTRKTHKLVIDPDPALPVVLSVYLHRKPLNRPYATKRLSQAALCSTKKATWRHQRLGHPTDICTGR